MTVAAEVTTADLFRVLYGELDLRGYVCISTVPGKRGTTNSYSLTPRAFIPAVDAESIAAEIQKYAGAINAYFNVCPIAAPLSEGRGTVDDVVSVPGFYADIDIADPCHAKQGLPKTIEEARELASSIGAEPSIILHTGHGLQCYWLTTSPIIIECEEDRAAAVELHARFRETLKHNAKLRGVTVDSVNDLARVLRPLGSKNHNGAAVLPVTVVEWNADHRFLVDDIAALLLPPPKKSEPVAKPTNHNGHVAAADEAIVGKVRALPKWDALWNGDTSAYQSPSEADLSLCGRIAFFVGRDAGRVSSIFRQSSLYREKWDTPRRDSTYGADTAAKAVDGCRDFYNWNGRSNGNGSSNGKAPPAPPAPIPLDSPRAPELPEGIFQYWLGDFINAAAVAAEVPRELPATFALGAVSTVIQRRFSVLISPGYFEPTNIWPLCAMTSGNRKTEAMRKAIAPLALWEEQQAAELLPDIEKAKSERKTIEARISRLRADAAKAKAGDFERLKNEIAEMEAALPEVPKVPQLFSQDVTPEHTGTMLADNDERLALISDEGGIFDVMAGRYNSGIPNLDVYLQAHAGSFVRADRGSRPAVNLKYPALTIAVSPQPDVLVGMTSHKGFRGRGLLARFAYMIPASRLGYRSNSTTPIPDHVNNAYRDGIFALAAVTSATDGDRKVPHVLTLNGDALSLWRALWADVETMMRPDGRLAHLTDWGGKLPGLVARVAGLLHCVAYASCATSTKEIDGDTMERAIRFGRYLIDHAVIAFGVMGADPAMEAARDLWRVIEKARQPKITVRDAWHPLRGTYKAVADVEPGFDVLIDHAYLIEPHQADDEAPRRRGRPPSRMFHVNPLLTRGWA